MEPRRIVDFAVYSAFYLLEQSDNFQVSYMWNWKPEIDIFFYSEVWSYNIKKLFLDLILSKNTLHSW